MRLLNLFLRDPLGYSSAAIASITKELTRRRSGVRSFGEGCLYRQKTDSHAGTGGRSESENRAGRAKGEGRPGIRDQSRNSLSISEGIGSNVLIG